MYCISCGKQIEVDSNYCTYCGQKVVLGNSPHVASEISLLTVEEEKITADKTKTIKDKAIDAQPPETVVPEAELKDHNEDVFNSIPTTTTDLTNNSVLLDASSTKTNITPSNLKHTIYDESYQRDFMPAVFGSLLILASILTYFMGNSNGYELSSEDYLFEQKKRQYLSIASVVIRIVVAMWVANIATFRNRNSTGWLFLGFFFPGITLVVLSFKKKLLNRR
ncbi:MAG TPA: zinc ribbon domain-containing protein [Segetibacter sp.]|jgi:DNA-directed RNA polymerase subunit RPC12/RpoP